MVAVAARFYTALMREDLALDSASSGALARAELLETVRIDNDEVTVKWTGWSFEARPGRAGGAAIAVLDR